MLDVAAGSGIYGHTFLRSPHVEVTFVDWPNVLPETRAWGERMGVDLSRAHFVPGDVFEVDLGGTYDLVLASHLYHHFDRRTCQTLTHRLAGAVAPNGRLAVHDFVAGPGLENPGATMFSLVMLVWTRPGMPTTWLVAERR